MKPLPEGKGLYVWNIKSMPAQFVDKCIKMGLTWIAVKIADGVNSSNLRPLADGSWADDLLPPFVEKFKAAGMLVYGWQYVYGFNPMDEALKAAQRTKKFGLDGFIIDAEHQYKGKYNQAAAYSMKLRGQLPNAPIGLSTYRFPKLHPRLPYNEFLYICNFNAPQVYWNKGKAGDELTASYNQYKTIKELPFIPAGRAYEGEGFPEPTPSEIEEFLGVAQHIGCPAAFFWCADTLFHFLRPLPEIQVAIAEYDWEGIEPEPEPEPEPCPVLVPPLSIHATLTLDFGEVSAAYTGYLNRDVMIIED